MVCGVGNSLGLTFQADDDFGVFAEFDASPLWQGYEGVLHGGMICTLLDSAMTHCLFQQGVEAMTAELQVRFIKPVLCTEKLQLKAVLKSKQRNLFHLYAELGCYGEVLAKGEARFLLRK
jgi:uncharacterized protein (TIGR00369 family)